jgi:chromatin segregation and condensation protein Rec8/ScpA/Scc1 (kleisin family)
MDKSTTGQVFNIADLEKEIEAEVRNSSPIRSQNSVDFAPRRVREPTIAIPDYVEHNEGATEIGRLSAEAVVREYEAAAKEIEEIGGELIERVKQCEAMTLDALAVTEELKQTAQRYRDEAKRVFHQIENCTLMTAEVRKTCTELKERLTAPAAAPA